MFQQKQIQVFLQAVPAVSPEKNPGRCTKCTYIN